MRLITLAAILLSGLYLCSLNSMCLLVTNKCIVTGVQGQYMGSDEKEIVYIAYQALNVTEKQVTI